MGTVVSPRPGLLGDTWEAASGGDQISVRSEAKSSRSGQSLQLPTAEPQIFRMPDGPYTRISIHRRWVGHWVDHQLEASRGRPSDDFVVLLGA